MQVKHCPSKSELREYKNCAVRSYIAATDLESALRLLPILNDRELSLLVMASRDLAEVLQEKLKLYINTL